MENVGVTLDELQQECCKCQQCHLRSGCNQVVFGEGNPQAQLMLVGEGPGEQEDLQGRPFVGPAGQLLDKILDAVKLSRQMVYIANIVKCRPANLPGVKGYRPGAGTNRQPNLDEIQACLPWLEAQIALIQPQIIICLGSIAARSLIEPGFAITSGRGQWVVKSGLQIMPTYHPAALLRDPSKKRDVWEDMQQVMKVLHQ